MISHSEISSSFSRWASVLLSIAARLWVGITRLNIDLLCLDSPTEVFIVETVLTYEIAQKIECGDHVPPQKGNAGAIVLLEVVVLAVHVLQNNAAYRTEELNRALSFLVQQAGSMYIPDLQSSPSKAMAEIQLLAVEKERFIKAADSAKRVGAHQHARSQDRLYLPRGLVIPARKIGL